MDRARGTRARRNRLLQLLTRKVNAARGAARHVFADEPDIVREFTSGYERRRRAESRRSKQTEGESNKPDLSGGTDANKRPGA